MACPCGLARIVGFSTDGGFQTPRDADFTAFAPDLYDGKIAIDIPGAKHLRTEMANNSDKDNKVLAEAVRSP